jgi:hypothetical protein
MMHGMVMKWVFMISWLITALISINVGMHVFNYDFFRTDFAVMNLYSYMDIIHYIILAAGCVSLALFIMSVAGNCACSSCNGKRK